MSESIVESVKAFISPKFIKAQHFKHHGSYTFIAYIMRTFNFYKMSRVQYNLSIRCSTIWHKYYIKIGKLHIFIFLAMEMEKLYSIIGGVTFIH